MSKRTGIGKSMFVRNWGNSDNQLKFDDPKIQRGLNLAKKLSKKSMEIK